MPDTLYDALRNRADEQGRSVDVISTEALSRYVSDDPEFEAIMRETLTSHRTILDRLADL